MPIRPEKGTSRQEVRDAIASQFWEQPVQSARTVEGLTHTLPCEPPPLTQTGFSGLSRTQQLVAAQALGVPVFPSYDHASGGVVRGGYDSFFALDTTAYTDALSHCKQVFDRVMAKLGAYSWWTAVTVRMQAQRLLQQHREGAKLVRVALFGTAV